MKIGVNDGHTLRGAGTGAVGIIKEGEHTRLVGEEVRRLLKEKGNTVYNCTVDYASTVNESLSLVVQQANREDLDWFISIHFNAGGGQGVEVYTYEGRQYQDAIDVCKNISSLGFINRGVKAGTGLYVIRRTKAKSMLIEVCFVDTEDANKYLSVGYKAIAKAIVDALDNHIVSDPVVDTNTSSTSQTQSTVTTTGDDWIRRLQQECNNQGFSKQNVDGIAGPATLAGCPTLRKGASGNITKLLQEKLISLRYDLGKYGSDGVFGTATYNAVVKFQKDNGLTPDGIVGQNTWRKLLNL
ncbi:N-acetylmuramoyl-L-alanine amidase [Clostridium disporicum]|uniref:N-acetylmuramoyl-L-alanine amidase n=1 Tax=Clostridium disporicum TaxID=84024 RepID=UPI0006C2DCA3|nr:N-acetylmuramoyl-L-alanine amidase [Clostridium disporicum]CUN36567.1 N-acetylmuramoyl-L-alanine amidase [Clostridium disporicum]